MNDKPVSIQAAAKILSVSTKTLRRWDKAGILVANRTSGNQRRYTREQIESFISSKAKIQDKATPFFLKDYPQAAEKNYEEISPLTILRPSRVGLRVLFSSLVLLVIIFGINVFLKTQLGSVIKDINLGFNSTEPKDNQATIVYNDQEAVLGEATASNNLLLKVNIPSVFNDSSEFINGLKTKGIATLSGGLITENQDIDAGTGTITASNVLYRLLAGTGLSVGTGQTPTIANTGVLSIGGKTGTVALSAGSGISISDVTITNSDKGSSQNIFKKITVGSSDINAGSNSDTLTLAAGTGITLTTDTTNKKVTIAGPSESGWTDDGTMVRLTTSTDSVGIGTTSPSTTLHVVGTSTFTSTSSFNGGVTLGDATSDTLTIYSRVTVGNDTTGNALEPTTGSKFDLGSSARTWRTIYVDTLSAGNTSINGSNSDDFRINADNTTADTENSTLSFERGSPATNAVFRWNATGTPSKLLSLNAPLFINPDTGIDYSGTSALIVDQPQSQDIFTASSSATTRFRISNAGHVLPGADNSYDIGSSSLQWRNLYVAGQVFGGASGTQGHWQRASGSLAPANITDDLLLGATATSSARFAVLNIAGGTPTASVSAGTAGGAYLSATGILATTAMQTLSLGGSTTGNITIDSGNSSVTLSDDTTISGDLAVNGATSADITSTTTAGTLFNTTVTTLSLGGAATTLNLGTTDSVTRTINLGTGTGADTINIGTGGTTADAITLGNTGVTTTLAFNTGVTTGTGFAIAANSVTSGNTLTISSTAMTIGEVLDVTGTWAPTDGSTNEAIDINITHTPTTSADNFRSIDLDSSDGTALGNTIYNYDGTLTLTGNAAKTGYGIYQTVTSNSTTADTIYSLYAANSVTGAISIGTRNTYGVYSNPAQSGANTGGTSNLYGVYLNPSSTASTTGSTVNVYGAYVTNTGTLITGGTINSYGLYVANGTSDIVGTSTKYGLYVESPTGADNNYAAIFAGGYVGIGTATPRAELEIDQAGSSSTGGLIIGQGSTIYAQFINTDQGVLDDDLRLSVVGNGGTNYYLFTDNGNMGISNSGDPPDERLDINGSTAANTGIVITNTNASDFDTFIRFELVEDTGNFTLGVDDSVTGDPFKISTTALGTGDMLTLDSRSTTSGVSTVTLAGIAPTIASATGAEYTTLTVTPPTITLTGGTGVTSVMDSILINAPTITDATAITIDKAATVTIAGNPAAGGLVTITAPRALNVDGRVEINLAGTQTSVALCGSHAAAGGASVSDVEIVDCTGTPGADYMEMYPVATNLETGDLVMPGQEYVTTKDGARISKLVKATSPYEGRLLGVVSNASYATDFNSIGYNIKEEDNPMPIALNGRVQVKVSLENGPIAVGDYLTSSSTSGVAMKATKPGHVIGMALESSEQCSNLTIEQCKIMVFVNLGWRDPTIYIAADGNLSNQSLAAQSNVPAESDLVSNSETASTSAQTTFNLANDPTFQDLQNKVDLLETKINGLAQTSLSASTSALLSEIQQTSDAISLNTETIEQFNNATVSGTVTVLGRTTLSDLGVTGNINAGLLTIHGLVDDTSEVCSGSNLTSEVEPCAGSSLNTLSGNLYLQNQGLGGIDILAGKIVIDTKGNIKIEGTITAKAIEAEELVVKGKDSIGTATIPQGLKEIEIATPVATSTSKIFVTATTTIASPLAVVSKDNGKFKVVIANPEPTPVTFDWWVVGNN